MVATARPITEQHAEVEKHFRSTSKKLGQSYFVIDCDRHIIEPPEAFSLYLDPEWRHQAPRLVTDNSGAPRLMVEGRLYQKPSGFGPGRPEGCGDQRPRGDGLSYELAYRHAFENRNLDMDLSGIDCALWIPTLGLFTPDIENADLQYAVMRALNDWTAKEWSTEKRHLWCVTIPLKPEWAVAEIRRCHDLGATAVWMRPNVMQGVRWWQEDWEIVWQTMAELGMALVFHEATGTYNATHSTDYKFDRYWLAHAVSHPLEMATALSAIIGYGVLERHPRLNVLFCEGGATWVPYMLFRLDNHFEARPGEMGDLCIAPSAYFRRQCVICSFEPEEALLRETMAWLDGKHMACTSDYPHWDSSGVSGVVRYLENYPQYQRGNQAQFLFTRCHCCIRPGGRVAVSDTIPETTFEQPNFGETPSNQGPLELLDGNVLPQAGEILEVATVQGEMICLARSMGGELVAFQSNCPHRGVPLCHGILEGDLVICLEHFWRWQARNGEPAGGAQVALHSYRIYHQGDRVLLFPQSPD